jgi:long-chain fatty acid transport protein
MKHFLKLAAISVLMVCLSTGVYSNGLNLNSNGSKAIAMGGAFVGLADDYSAVFWNPAGLTQMKETNVALFGTDIIPDLKYQFTPYGIDTKAEDKHYISGGLGFFKPLSDKVVVGIYAYVPAGLGNEWNGADLLPLWPGGPYKWSTMVAMFTVSPAVAFKLSDQFSIGATLNINYGIAKLKKPGLGQFEMDLDGTAFGATFGALFKPSEKFSIGVCYKTQLKAKLKGDATMSGAPLYGLPTTDKAELNATWPMWLAGGIAIKPTDKLTITADVQYTNWKKMDTLPLIFSNVGWKAAFESGAEILLYWEDTVQLRAGLEYMVSEKFALRGGYYYDPGPGPKKTLNILLPEVTYNWITLGFGYKTEKITLDVGLEYAMGKDLTAQPSEIIYGMPGTISVGFIVPNIALTIRF